LSAESINRYVTFMRYNSTKCNGFAPSCSTPRRKLITKAFPVGCRWDPWDGRPLPWRTCFSAPRRSRYFVRKWSRGHGRFSALPFPPRLRDRAPPSLLTSRPPTSAPPPVAQPGSMDSGVAKLGQTRPRVEMSSCEVGTADLEVSAIAACTSPVHPPRQPGWGGTRTTEGPPMQTSGYILRLKAP